MLDCSPTLVCANGRDRWMKPSVAAAMMGDLLVAARLAVSRDKGRDERATEGEQIGGGEVEEKRARFHHSHVVPDLEEAC